MLRTALFVTLMIALPHTRPAHAKDDPNEPLYAAARKGNADKVARILEGDVSRDARIVALAITASNNRPEAFTVLWTHDNSDISAASLDYALCYAHHNRAPAAEIAEVVEAHSLTIDACCSRNGKQAYCAKRPIRLTSREYPPAPCAKVFVDDAEVPEGATRIATLWDERVSVLDSASSAKYGTRRITRSGSKDWAMEFAPVLGRLGADAILISSAETIEAKRSDPIRYPGGSVTWFKYGEVIDRIELVAIRLAP